ncbi:MAG: glycosyltransferase family 9 protein [Planctomycetota bacterium]|nr:glycosyltransferase family 9 protein [Planctomycetota bacterium]
MEKRPRILITRLSAIGDCILTMPLLCALRRRFPDALLAWATQPGPAKLLQGHECLDELIVVSRGWLKSPRMIWQLRRRLRALQFDITIDPQGLTKSAVLARLSGAPRRIGFAAPRGRELSVWLNNELQRPTRSHLVDCQLDLLQTLGATPGDVRFAVPSEPAACAAMASFLANAKFSGPFAVINPGAGWDSKLWPADRFAQVAAQLGQRFGLPAVVAWGGDRERGWAAHIAAGAQGQAILAPPTTLPELAALLRKARLLVSSDSGPMHLAAAVGTPCVGLFGPTRPEDCGPYGPGHRTVQAYYQAGTSRQRRRASNDALRAISVDMVLAACEHVKRVDLCP